jgi:hypothetical protein
MKVGDIRPGEMSDEHARCLSSGVECDLHVSSITRGIITGAALGVKSESADHHRLTYHITLHCGNCGGVRGHDREYFYVTDIPPLAYDARHPPDWDQIIKKCARAKLAELKRD